MTNAVHTHNHTDVVRMRGSRVRKQCACKHIGPWEKVRVIEEMTPVAVSIDHGPNPHDFAQMTVTQLREFAKSKGISGYSKATKAELITMVAKQSA